MQVTDVKEWRSQGWTRLYESALFERDPVRLCARLWDAQLEILSRQKEVRRAFPVDLREELALRKALGILADLRRLSGLDDVPEKPRRRNRKRSHHALRAPMMSVRSATRGPKRITTGI